MNPKTDYRNHFNARRVDERAVCATQGYEYAKTHPLTGRAPSWQWDDVVKDYERVNAFCEKHGMRALSPDEYAPLRDAITRYGRAYTA